MVKSRVLLVSLLGAAAVVAVPLVTAIAMQKSEPSASDIGLLAGVIQLVNHAYVHPISSEELTKDALKGMLTRLDPHSDYMDEQEFKQSQSDMAGSFGGLGMQISEKNEIPNVISPIDGTPAARAGLEPGDLIIMINHSSTQGVNLSKVVSLLRGDPGTKVTITVLRGKQAPFDVTLTREIIKVESVKSRLEPDGIGYIRIIALHRMTEVRRKAFDRRNRAALGPRNGCDTGPHGLAVDMHRARSAPRDPAAVFGARQLQTVTKHPKERRRRVVVETC
jgi:carboxyl-terminal processing protease